jgi:hypothetical protein
VNARFDPYALLEPLQAEKVAYVVVGGFARVVHGSGETTRAIDIVPSSSEGNLRRLGRAADALGAVRHDGSEPGVDQLAADEPLRLQTRAGTLILVPTPWGTRGYDDIRIRATRENLGRGLRPQIASLLDLARMLEASTREQDRDRLLRLRRLMELERQLTRRRGLGIER